MKHIKADNEFNDFGCPFTEMRSRREAFEAAFRDLGLNFHMKEDAPHYSYSATRIAFMNWIAGYNLAVQNAVPTLHQTNQAINAYKAEAGK